MFKKKTLRQQWSLTLPRNVLLISLSRTLNSLSYSDPNAYRSRWSQPAACLNLTMSHSSRVVIWRYDMEASSSHRLWSSSHLTCDHMSFSVFFSFFCRGAGKRSYHLSPVETFSFIRTCSSSSFFFFLVSSINDLCVQCWWVGSERHVYVCVSVCMCVRLCVSAADACA